MKVTSRFCAVGTCAAATLLSSCVAPYYGGPNESVGSVLGAAGGAIAGGIIGHQSGRGLEGAALGGILGSWAGSSIGYAQDRYYYGDYYRPRPVTRVYGGYYGGYYDACPPPRYYGGYRSYSAPCW